MIQIDEEKTKKQKEQHKKHDAPSERTSKKCLYTYIYIYI